MDHHLTIEGETSVALASELAALTGETVGEAVTNAIRERLEATRARTAKVEYILALAADYRASLTGPAPSRADLDALYDSETGLPI